MAFSRAIDLVRPCMAPRGLDASVRATTVSTRASSLLRGAPAQAASSRPSSRSRTPRPRHLETVCLLSCSLSGSQAFDRSWDCHLLLQSNIPIPCRDGNLHRFCVNAFAPNQGNAWCERNGVGWKSHVLKLAIMGRLPFGKSMRKAKRRLFGYPPDPDNLRGTLSNLAEIKGAVESTGRSFTGASVLEIGSGWFPVIPIMLSLYGAKKVVLSDLSPHMDATTFAATLAFLQPQLKNFPGTENKLSVEDFGLEYLSPFRVAAIPDGSIDIVISRTVLEHISAPQLHDLLAALRPKLAPHGIMAHYVDHSDHLEHRDKSISRINFLTWSDTQHGIVNWLTKEGENRLRHHEYREVFEDSGYEILSESGQPHKSTLALAPQLALKGRFVNMTPEQVSILSSIYLLSPRNKIGDLVPTR